MTTHPVLLFDGVCNLCNAAIRWVIARDVDAQFRFASLQSAAARRLLERAGHLAASDAMPDSIVLLDGEGVHVGSSAALRVARLLGFPSSLALVGLVLPHPLREASYRFIARNRYRWFGRRDACMVPTADVAARFLDAGDTSSGTPSSEASSH